MYLLDTNVISEIRRIKFGKCDPNVAAWIRTISDEYTYLNAIIMMELERGVLAMERKDILQGEVLRNWLDNIVKPGFRHKIFPIDAETAKICAKLHIPDRSTENEAWIAATAIQHNLTLVTRNTADFERLGVKLFNPFQ